MTSVRFLCLALLGWGALPALADQPIAPLIPWPQKHQPREGQMALTAGSWIMVDDATLKPLAAVLAGEIQACLRLKLAVVDATMPRPGDIILKLDPTLE
ncbi:MAG: hypothetical protein NT031_10970, partial [Planctomycetota bacterium]|nr:hypothetical protein [Planctomycetota bacterium]